jgi:hypothetical protein
MTNVTSAIEFDVVEHFDADGTLIISIYQKGLEEPLIEHEIRIPDVVTDFLDIVCNPDDDLIEDSADEEVAEAIIDELQEAIDMINDSLRDYDIN